MRKPTFRLIAVLAASLAATAVIAAGSVRYKWRDAEGNLHYTDSLPSDAGVRGYDVINAQGILVKRVEPAKTAEERAAAKADAAVARANNDAAERQKRDDRQLLAANPTEEDLKANQQQQLEMIDLHVKSLTTGLESLERSLTDLLGRAAEFESNDKPVPARLSGQISDVRTKIDAQHAQLNRQTAEREATAAGFVGELEHYRALSDKHKQH